MDESLAIEKFTTGWSDLGPIIAPLTTQFIVFSSGCCGSPVEFPFSKPVNRFVRSNNPAGIARIGVHGYPRSAKVGGNMVKPKRGRSTAAVDDHVGARIRERRIMLGLTQQQLAELIGVTYQQAHKYERGINRVSAGRLFEIARVLSVPIGYFYEGIGDETPRQVTQRERMMLEIARNFAEITNERHQEAVSQLARALAAQE